MADVWINVAVKLLRPIERWHAWRYRTRKAKGKFDRGAVTTMPRPSQTDLR